MYTFIIFTVLCLIEFIYIAYKWSVINEMKENARQLGEISKALGMQHTKAFNSNLVQANLSKGKRIGLKLVMFMARFKSLIFMPIVILLLINLVISLIFGIFVALLV